MVQLYAQSGDGEKIFVERSVKGIDYFCLECLQKVRLRGGMYRQLHFYHIDEGKKCRQSEKTIEHILTQKKLQDSIPEIQLEVRFPDIGRVADAVLFDQKLVFEVQVSPMTQEECVSRIEDYRKAGFETIFILHTKTYGHRLSTPIEEVLERHTHYFTNINETGGVIFDMLSWISRRRRLFLQDFALKRCVIDIGSIRRRDPKLSDAVLEVLKKREQNWLLQAYGDLLSQKLTDEHLKEAMAIESALHRSCQPKTSALQRYRQFVRLLYEKIVESCL